jgi:hypothetical protein
MGYGRGDVTDREPRSADHDEHRNGVAPEAPNPDQLILVAGGAGYVGCVNLAGLSNDPTAEFNPEANWQMNAIATERLGAQCVRRGIERFVFATSCSLYDDVGIDWPLPTAQLIASERDSRAPRLADIADSLPFEFTAAADGPREQAG